jgi:hypothetical protein
MQAQLTVRRWTRHGQDRLYVSAGPVKVGFVDLATGYRRVDIGHLSDDFDAAVASWRASNPGAVPVSDYAVQAAGAGLQQRAAELRPRPWLLRTLAAVMGVRTRDRSWRVGAAGERKVGASLDRLPDGWLVLHGIQLGRGGDIDHLLIGPPGIFTVNTKHHPGARVQVGRKVMFVRGKPWPYIGKAAGEADRVREALRAALGRPLHVGALVAVVGHRSLRGWLRSTPQGVRVLPRWALRLWFGLPGRAVLSPAEVTAIYEAARKPATWTYA